MTKIPDHNLYNAKPGTSTLKADFQTVEWGREANAGWQIGRSSNPVLFTADGHNVRLEDSARGSSVLITDKSFKTSIDLNNVHVWAVGEAITEYPCKIWTPDDCGYDLKYWNNQSILKLLPLQMARQKRKDEKYISHSPNCFYYRRHSSFNPAFFLQEETIWNDGSKESHVMSALQLAIILGYREIYIAADMKTDSRAYQHIQNINKFLINHKIKVFSCGNMSIFPRADITAACSSCILN